MGDLLGLLYGRPDRAPVLKSEDQFQEERVARQQRVISFAMTPHDAQARQAIGDFLSEALIKPFATHLRTDEDIREDRRHGKYDTKEIGVMMHEVTVNERIAIEIEMQQRQPSLYASDYDPLGF